MTNSDKRLILFGRFPEPGRVKTRLIPALGTAGAVALHRRLLLRTLRAAQAACRVCGAELELRFEGGSVEAFQHWLGDSLACRPQAEGELGARMSNAFEESFREGPSATVIIGSDCPALTPDILASAFEQLQREPVVIGPATDGGYYLIGLARHNPKLFCGVSWGTERVLSESMAILRQMNLVPRLLPQLDDIDRPSDLPVWRRSIERDESGPRRITVIIPALNEASGIGSTLESVHRGKPEEVLVVDGGSTDATSTLAARSGATVMFSGPGRGRQMNAGAARAGGNVLLFLHADTTLPSNWTQVVKEALSQSGVVAGAFGFQIAAPVPGKRMLEWATNWRSRRLGMPYGDQALFVGRGTFEEEGGFADVPIMEDYELVRRLRRRGRIVTVAEVAVTSGRRWQRLGVLRATWRNQLVIAGFHLGIRPQKLAAFYRK
jgi:rSAM/selenodomain-associated transferase 2/rSAM/selenodomain-associated transferase 1